MIADAAALIPEYLPRHAAKELANLLGISVRHAKRLAAHPELFPKSRAEELIAVLARLEAEQQERAAARRKRLETVTHELCTALGLSHPRLPLSSGGVAGRRLGGAVERAGAVVQEKGA